MKTFRTIVAFFQALLPLLGFGIISAVIYSDFKPPYNLIIAIAVFILGIYASRSIFNMMRRRGVISTMSGDNATYDLDELEPTPGSGVLKVTPEDLTQLFIDKKLKFNNGITVSIWGDWEGRKLDVKHTLNSIEFNSDNNILTIQFNDNCLLKITRPSLILCSNSYLKIVKAKEVLWQIPMDSAPSNQYSYLNTGKEIKTRSNTKWRPHEYDIGIGMNAIYLQG